MMYSPADIRIYQMSPVADAHVSDSHEMEEHIRRIMARLNMKACAVSIQRQSGEEEWLFVREDESAEGRN